MDRTDADIEEKENHQQDFDKSPDAAIEKKPLGPIKPVMTKELTQTQPMFSTDSHNQHSI